MRYPWLDDYCQAKKACLKEYKVEWKATRYMLCGKIFALWFRHKDGRMIINLKTDPAYGLELQTSYPDITPGYHMNKFHWSSVYLDGSTPDEVLKEMVDESYNLILYGLSKAKRNAILEGKT